MIKILIEMQIIKIFSLIILAKVKIKVMGQNNKKYIDLIYLKTLLTKNKVAFFLKFLYNIL